MVYIYIYIHIYIYESLYESFFLLTGKYTYIYTYISCMSPCSKSLADHIFRLLYSPFFVDEQERRQGERKEKKKKIEDTIESRSLKKKKFRRSRGIFDSSRRRGWTDASFFGYSMFAMSNVLGFAQQERLSSHCRLHVFKTKKKKKKAKPVEAEWRSWKRFVLKMEWKIGRYDRHGGYMGYWTIIIEQQNFRLDT